MYQGLAREMKMFGFVLMTQSSRLYHLVHVIFGLSSSVAFWRTHRRTIHSRINALRNRALVISQVIAFCGDCHSHPDAKIVANLDVNAVSMLPFLAKTEIDHSSLRFVLMAWKSEELTLDVRLYPHSQRSADRTMQPLINEVLFALSDTHVKAWFRCSDNEVGYSQRHRTQFLDWHTHPIDFDCHAMVKCLGKKRGLPVFDILYIGRNRRADVTDYNMCLNPSCFQTRRNAR
jgi:hypothetical protein